MPALALYLDAPLQSWGNASEFQLRQTGTFPTKSGVVGLFAAALGIDKHRPDEADLLAPLIALRLTVIKLTKPDPRHPAGRPVHRLQDFHTVGGGYDKKASLREKLSIPRKASGAPFGTVITRRSYLTDAAFAVVVEGLEEQLIPLAEALLDPVWGIWFGRKCCIPASPLNPVVGEDLQSALDQLLGALPGHQPSSLANFEYQQDCNQPDFYQSDLPRAFGQHHAAIPTPYRSRALIHHRP